MLHFQSNKSDLYKAVSLTQNIINKKCINPALSFFLLVVKNNELQIFASDLEITAMVTIPCSVETAGATCIKASIFSEIVKELPDTTVNIKVSMGEKIEISSGKAVIKVNGMNSNEFPNLNGIGLPLQGRILAKQLGDMISKTVYASSHDESSLHLNGVCFEPISSGRLNSSPGIRMVALDGFRLALITRPCSPLSVNEKVIAHRRGLSELRRILEAENPDSIIEFDIRDGFLSVRTANVEFAMGLIDGNFPDYSFLFQENSSFVLSVYGRDLNKPLRRVSLLAENESRKVCFEISKGSLRVSTSDKHIGEAEEDIPINYDGLPISIGFNVRYILDIINVLGEDQEFTIELNSPELPGKFYATSDPSAYGILMPIRL